VDVLRVAFCRLKEDSRVETCSRSAGGVHSIEYLRTFMLLLKPASSALSVP